MLVIFFFSAFQRTASRINQAISKHQQIIHVIANWHEQESSSIDRQ